jgi:hypothetical protein
MVTREEGHEDIGNGAPLKDESQWKRVKSQKIKRSRKIVSFRLYICLKRAGGKTSELEQIFCESQIFLKCFRSFSSLNI